MSRRGNCHDNAAMVPWHSTLKAELGERFSSCADVKQQLFAYLEVFDNRQRRRSTLGCLSPVEYERTARMDTAA